MLRTLALKREREKEKAGRDGFLHRQVERQLVKKSPTLVVGEVSRALPLVSKVSFFTVQSCGPRPSTSRIIPATSYLDHCRP
uniref:Serine/threonine-protein kinase SRK2E n=1 Tax=Rhizophora mucronata TaxID=61149 RepID=A0A2P2LT12_RHIMU